jgi:arsenate reductase
MAEGLLRAGYGHRFEVSSAGTERAEVRPQAIKVMQEIGIDISGHYSKTIDDLEDRSFDYVVTVCDRARENCPYMAAERKNLHQSFEDPSAAAGTDEEKLAVFRRVREAIAEWIDETLVPATTPADR